MPRSSEIIGNADALEERYVPHEILFREGQIARVQACICPALKGRRPLHAWLHGPPGTGKTLVTKSVLNELEEHRRARIAFINCCDFPTHYAILSRVIEELGILGNNQERSTAFKIDTIRKHVTNGPVILALDELNRMPAKEREKLLWTFWNMEKVGLVCISTSIQALYSIEPGLLERISPVTVEFPSYTPREIAALLEKRAELAFHDSTWNRRLLQYVASLARGNALLGIQTLRRAAEFAENEAKTRIEPAHVRDAFSHIRSVQSCAILQRLSRHHRSIHEILRNNPGITSGELRDAYLLACETSSLRPASERAFQLYVTTLLERGILHAERPQVHGNTRRFWVME